MERDNFGGREREDVVGFAWMSRSGRLDMKAGDAIMLTTGNTEGTYLILIVVVVVVVGPIVVDCRDWSN